LNPLFDLVKENGMYDYVKERTGAGSGVTSKDLFQMAADPSLDPQMKAALMMRAQAKKKQSMQFQNNFKTVMAQLKGDESAQKIHEEAEKQSIKTLRALNGLDEGGGEDGASQGSSAAGGTSG
jgi:hypothetical protein